MGKARIRALVYLLLFLFFTILAVLVTWIIDPGALATPGGVFRVLASAAIGVATVFAFLIIVLELFVIP